MQVACRPSLSSLTIEALPVNLMPYVSLSSSLPPAQWEAICESVHQQADSRSAQTLVVSVMLLLSPVGYAGHQACVAVSIINCCS